MTQKEPRRAGTSSSFSSVLRSEGCHWEHLYPSGGSLWSAGQLLGAAVAPHAAASAMMVLGIPLGKTLSGSAAGGLSLRCNGRERGYPGRNCKEAR